MKKGGTRGNHKRGISRRGEEVIKGAYSSFTKIEHQSQIKPKGKSAKNQEKRNLRGKDTQYRAAVEER